MPIITTFEQLRAHVSFISSSDPASGFIDTTAAEIRYLLPVLGATLYNAVVAKAIADPFDATYTDIINLCGAVAAPMAVFHKLATIQTNITDTGLKTSSTENFEPAHRWEYNEVKEQLQDQAGLALESLVSYLVANAGTFSWTNPYTGIFKTGFEFSEYFALSQPHRTFMMLRPVIKEAEMQLVTIMGQDFLNSLKAITEPTTKESVLLEHVKKFVAHYAITKAIEKLSVNISPQGFNVLMTAPVDQVDGKTAASDNQLSLLYNSTKADAKLFLGRIRSYLNENASVSVFADYYSSSYYVNPATKYTTSRNSCRKGIFGL